MQKLWERMAGVGARRWLRLASYALIAIGVILLVIAGVNAGLQLVEKRRLQARLVQTAPTPTVGPISTSVSATIEARPTDTLRSLETALPDATATTLVDPSPTERATETLIVEPTSTPEPTAVPSPLTSPDASLPVRIAFPDLEIDAAIVEMGWKVAEVDGTRTSVWDLDAIRDGVAGHLLNSALPGQPGNVVVSGHHNIEGQVFKNISLAWNDDHAELQEDGVTERSSLLDGRLITVTDAAGREFTYVVEGMYRLPDKDVSLAQRIENSRFMASTSDALLTVTTCWPFSSNTHRIAVIAGLVEMGS